MKTTIPEKLHFRLENQMASFENDFQEVYTVSEAISVLQTKINKIIDYLESTSEKKGKR